MPKIMNDSYLMNLMEEGKKKNNGSFNKENHLKDKAFIDENESFVSNDTSRNREDSTVLSDEFKKSDYKVIQDLIGQIVNKIESQRTKKSVSIEDDPDAIMEIIENEINKKDISPAEKERLIQVAKMEILGLGPLDDVASDDSVTEIIVQRYDNVVVERRGIIEQTDIKFQSEDHLLTVIKRIVSSNNRALNIHTPMTDAMLKDGSRVNATIPPASPDGATLSIRKFGKTNFTPKDFIDLNSLSVNMLYFLSVCVLARKNIIISGGTSSGKTSLLNTLASFIPKEELVVTIEQTLELRLERKNIRRLLERIEHDGTMMMVDSEALIRNALRMRPDRIIQGEIRDGAIVSMISAMSTGHEGSMSTVHANSPRDLLDVRLPILYSMDKSTNFDRESQMLQIASALDVIVQIHRFKAGKLKGKRRITNISVVKGYDEQRNRVLIDQIFGHDVKTDTFYATGLVPEEIVYEASGYGIDVKTDVFKKTIQEY